MNSPVMGCGQLRIPQKGRDGVTVVELLVVIGVISLLMALIVPAVGSARAAARQQQCTNNLHQIGIGMHSFADSAHQFPTGKEQVNSSTGLRVLEFHSRILPMLDQAAALSQVMSQKGASVPVYHCPEDPEVKAATIWALATNYFVNNGVGFTVYTPSSGFGIDHRTDLKPSDITDGLSNTVALSERLWFRSSENPVTPNDPRAFWWTEERFYGREDVPKAIDQAMHHRTTVQPQSQLNYTFKYDHMLPPNHPASFNGPNIPGVDADHMLVPASSFHVSRVNSLFADGSVKQISNTIDLAVWHALGTRNGGESTSY